LFLEFGRRVKDGNGTDHGTAAPMFVIGGSNKGNYRKQSQSSDLQQGDLKHQTILEVCMPIYYSKID
jgi:uncharacterized protein (DUF1501 family)